MAASSTKRDYYDVLSIARNASDDEIKRAYRKLALQFHPDRNAAPDAADRFKEVTEAYQILSDSQKRTMYDRYGHAAFQTGAAGGGADFSNFVGVSIEDIFESFFGGTRGRAARAPRGQDLRYDMRITLEEAVFGAEKDVTLNRQITCEHCSGTRMEPGTEPIRCTTCNGTGEIRRTQQSIFGQFVNVMMCDRCNGEGTIISEPCHECHGRGSLRGQRTLRISIPGGSDDGLQIRLSGEGEPAPPGGAPGSLFVVLHVQPHRYFKRQGNDLLLEIPIDVAQATLGTEFEVKSLDGKGQALKVPAGSQSGRIVRLRGEGVPILRERGRGDLLVQLKVKIPSELTDEQKKLFHQLAQSFGTAENIPSENKSFFDKVKDVFHG